MKADTLFNNNDCHEKRGRKEELPDTNYFYRATFTMA